MTALRLGVSGCGRLAELGYLPALRRTTGMELVAIADPDATRRARLGELAARIGASPRAHRNAAEMLERGALDAIVVASPAEAHLADARCASAVGIPALVEKPPAPDAAGAAELAELEPAPFVGLNRRFRLERLRNESDAAGPLRLRISLRYRRRSWRAITVADDALGDLGPHAADVALWLSAAAPVEVRCRLASRERAELELVTSTGSAAIELATDRPHRELVAVATAGGDWRRSAEGGLASLLTGRIPGREHPLVRTLRAQLGSYEAALRGGDPSPLASAWDGVAVMSCIDAARRSAAAGGRAVAVEVAPLGSRLAA